MKVVYHPSVQGDVSRILRHYDSINDRLGDDFWNELDAFINQAAANPGRFHFDSPRRRRVNLRRIPYHFLFREVADGIRITVVRHQSSIPNADCNDGSVIARDDRSAQRAAPTCAPQKNGSSVRSDIMLNAGWFA